MLYFFCLLTGYYLLRPVREAMGASRDAATVFPQWMIDWFAIRGIALEEFMLQALFTGTFVIMLLLQPVYGALVSRYPRRVFLPVVYGFFIACLVAFYFAFRAELPGRGMVFFIWLTVFNLFAVAVFWSFMADVFNNDEAKRVYGYIGAGGTLGAMIGPTLTRLLVERIGIANLLLVSALLLSLCIVCILRLRIWAVQRERERGRKSGEVPMGGQVLAGLKLIAQEPLLRALAMLTFFGVGVGTLLYNEQAAIVKKFYDTPEARTAFFSSIDLAVNGLTLTVQVLLTRFLLSRYGIGPVLLIPAMAILVGFCALAASPFPMLVAVMQVVTRASEFSLAKPARETIYTRVGREWRYKAATAIDTVIHRGGDVTFAWVHKALSAAGSSMVFLAGVGVAVGMTFGAWRVIRAQRTLPDNADAAEETRR
ncbi:MFS transporter [Luteimonas sp. SX5]|uniref:MFS transporter n=2 Tax=Luteimonas galliterrae TaxID=2940486 RepID=A0ABT0MKC5_9GAMM|nr:MFS transporter [Luteimonas galliterrae]MCL1635330.1 MFS transporter [Luteimonas galliterrae]